VIIARLSLGGLSVNVNVVQLRCQNEPEDRAQNLSKLPSNSRFNYSVFSQLHACVGRDCSAYVPSSWK
jgi:hypothetical protein